jgi:hypothetical protein
VRPSRIGLLALLTAGLARAEPPGPLNPWPGDAATARARGPLGEALERFDFGDYEGAVIQLRPLVETGGAELPSEADRTEALRTYGIACTLTGRRIAAEDAFERLLGTTPSMRLDPQLVRPEAVALFDQVRSHRHDEALAAYRRSRPRRYAVLNLLPPAGQFQNRDRKKGWAIGAVGLALLGTNIVTGALLNQWEGPHHLFAGHTDDARALMPVNIVSFAALLSVVAYGIVDAFVVGHRLSVEERRAEERLRLQ